MLAAIGHGERTWSGTQRELTDDDGRQIKPMSMREYAELARDVHSVPAVTDETTLLAVTRTGAAASEAPIRCLGAEGLIAAWPRA